jgi:F-type H+-transporting ATPase subunit b
MWAHNIGFFLLEASDRSLFQLDGDFPIGVVVNMVFFILIAVLLTWLLWKPVKNILDARATKIEGDLRDAEDSKLSASQLKSKYELLLADIDGERAKIMEEARKLAAERRDAVLEEAKAEADTAKTRAQREIVVAQEQARDAIQAAIVDISTAMAAKLIEANIDQFSHHALFEEAMNELEATAFRQAA